MTKVIAEPKNYSITLLLTTTIAGLVSFSVGVVLILSTFANITNTAELLDITSNQLINSIVDKVRSQVEPVRYVAEHIKKQASSGSIDFTDKFEMTTTLKGAFAAAPELTGVSIWQSDGRQLAILKGRDGLLKVGSAAAVDNPEIVATLKVLKPDTPAVWGSPLRRATFSLLTYSTGIFRKGEKLGMVDAAISINSLSRSIVEMEKGTGFTGFVLYGKNHVLAHKNLPELSTAEISKSQPLFGLAAINDDVLAQFAKTETVSLFANDKYDVRSITTATKKYVVFSREITVYGKEPWTIGVYAPRNQLNTQLKRMVFSILAGIAMLVLSVITAFFLARRIAKPIKLISAAASKVGSLDLDSIPSLPVSRITELNNQTQTFNKMVKGLKWFEAYVPRKLVDKLIQQQDTDNIRSREENLTVMFTDIVGFTAMSENLVPQDVASLLNDHFEVLNACIEKTDGTLDKYIGDAVMAFWGAPDRQDDHALRACETALCIAETLEKQPDALRLKIAIHTGPLIVGNIGAKARMNYTVIGDTVNTCSRIEQLAGELSQGNSTFILLSQETADIAKTKFHVKPAGEYSVKGRKKRVLVYQLIGRK